MRIPSLCNGKNSPTPPTRNYKIKKNTVSPFYKDLKKFLTWQEYTKTNWKLTKLTIKTTIWVVQACWHHTNRQTSLIKAKCKNLAVACRRWCWCSVHTPISHICIQIDLFTDMVAILNLLDLRSIMGCPGGTHSVFTRAFRAKRELQCIFLRKKGIIITSEHSITIFFPI